MRKLKWHEQKLLKKTNFLEWKRTNNVGEARIVQRYYLKGRQEYYKYNKIIGMIQSVVAKLRLLPAGDEERLSRCRILIQRLYSMGLVPSSDINSLDDCLKVNVSDLCRRRLATVFKHHKFCESIGDAVRFIAQGHVAVGPHVITDPSIHVTREMEDDIHWSAGSAVRKHAATFNEAQDDFEHSLA